MSLQTYDQSKPWAKYWQPRMKDLPTHVKDAVIHGPYAKELLDTHDLAADGYLAVETGYTVTSGGGIIVACLTNMPGVDPADWAWLFGWHGDDASKYKLWHPLAHVDVGWKDGHVAPGYLGRTSMVTEYVGAGIQKLEIRFVKPEEVGVAVKEQEGQVAICAKVRLQGLPFDSGVLIHHLRKTTGGCEMRSRFWVGGEYIDSGLGRLAARLIPTVTLTESNARDLLVHCAEEMNHLAGFLKKLRSEFGN